MVDNPTAELNMALALAEDGQARDALDCFERAQQGTTVTAALRELASQREAR